MQSLDNIDETYILDWRKMRKLIGIFPDYLIKEATLKTVDYLLAIVSKVKCYFTKTFPTEATWCEAGWYRDLRVQTERECVSNGLLRVKKSPKLSVEDLEELCKELMSRNTKESICDRTLLVFLWQALGRIVEAGNILYTDIELIDTEKYSYHFYNYFKCYCNYISNII